MKIKIIFGRFLYLFAKWLPQSGNRIFGLPSKVFRRLCAKLILSKCGKKVNIERGATFSSRVELGDRSGLGINSYIQGTCLIGKDVMMGPNVSIYTVNHSTKRTDIPMNIQGNAPERAVTIGDDVWIGSNAILLPGVTIGNGCIVGAGAVVRSDVPDYAVVVGNPAQVLKYRNN